MRRTLAGVALALGVLCAAPCRAQDDQGGEDQKRLDSDAPDASDKHPQKRKKKLTAEEELSDEKDEGSLSSLDDPHIGLSAEATGSVAFLNKSYGPGLLSSPGAGLRVDWSVGRLWTDPADDFWKYALLAELDYDYVGQSGGTQAINTTGAFHYLSLRGLFGYPIKDFLLLYGALGGGFTVESINYEVEGTHTGLTGVKPDFDYGLGGRIRIALNPSLSLAFRLELMRVRRDYLDDTFLTLGAGVDF